MNTELDLPETLTAAVAYFADPDRALAFMIALRWPDGVVRCDCGSSECTWMAKHARWRCRTCNVQFSVKAGTVFEQSPISLSKWMPAVWSIVNAKNGISSCELARALGVTQKTAWFMLHRIRLGMQDGGFVKDKFKGPVQVDESWIGGSARNMHKAAMKHLITVPKTEILRREEEYRKQRAELKKQNGKTK